LFLSLGLTNARRNLGRSLLAVAGAAVAAMIMTAILGLSGGYPAAAHLESRAFLGGDIVVYATRHLVRPDDLRLGQGAASGASGTGAGAGSAVAAAGGAAGALAGWEMTSLQPDLVCDLCSLHPELYSGGFLAPAGQAVRPIDLEQLRAALSGDPHVRYVNPSFFLPVRLTFQGRNESGSRVDLELPAMTLRARDFAGQEEIGGWPLGLSAPDGSPVRASSVDPHSRVAFLDGMLRRIPGYDVPPPGSKVTVHVPAVSVGQDGAWQYDFTVETAFEFTVGGNYVTRSNWVGWTDAMGTIQTEELFWITPQIQIPLGAFEEIFAAVSGGQAPTHAIQVGLGVTPFSQAEDIAARIQNLLPAYTVISVPRQMEMAHSRGLPEAAFRAPLEYLGLPTNAQVGMPVNLSRAFVVMACLIGALLLATNMLFLVAQRRREIGVLKAVGARGADVAVMILGEALTLSLVGTAVGFSLIRLLATWTLVSNRISIGEIARTTAEHFGMVAGAAAAAALLFGLLPAMRMARLTSMEVLRNE
jgi:ABC-type antimicrobial peptide transport system permease subunit